MIDRRRAASHRSRARVEVAIALVVALALVARRVRRQPVDREAADDLAGRDHRRRSGGGRRPRSSTRRRARRRAALPGVSGEHDHDRHEPPVVGALRRVHRDPQRRAGLHRLHERQRRRHGRGQEVPDQARRARTTSTSRSQTVTNVQSMLSGNNTFALFNVVGTKNNLAIRNLVNQECVPDLFAASGATQWGNHQYPWLIGSELVPYPLEVKTFVDYLKKTKPNATIAVLARQRRLRPVVRRHADAAREGHESEGRADPAVRQRRRRRRRPRSTASPRPTPTRSCSRARCWRARPRSPPRRTPAGTRSPTCRARACRRCCSAPRAPRPTACSASRRCSTRPIRRTRANPAMKLYKAQVAKYEPKAPTPPTGSSAYGWTTGALAREDARERRRRSTGRR